MKNENKDINKEILQVLKEILKWTKFQGWKEVKEVLLSQLKDERMKLIYHLSDGKSTRKIARKTGVSHKTVYEYWKKWSKVPIVEPIIVKGKTRYRKMFELEDFGIEIPDISKKEVENGVKQERSYSK